MLCVSATLRKGIVQRMGMTYPTRKIALRASQRVLDVLPTQDCGIDGPILDILYGSAVIRPAFGIGIFWQSTIGHYGRFVDAGCIFVSQLVPLGVIFR